MPHHTIAAYLAAQTGSDVAKLLVLALQTIPRAFAVLIPTQFPTRFGNGLFLTNRNMTEWWSSNFSCSLTSNIKSHSVENVSFHSFLRWKIIILPILPASLIHFSLKRLEECIFFNLVVERVWICWYAESSHFHVLLCDRALLLPQLSTADPCTPLWMAVVMVTQPPFPTKSTSYATVGSTSPVPRCGSAKPTEHGAEPKRFAKVNSSQSQSTIWPGAFTPQYHRVQRSLLGRFTTQSREPFAWTFTLCTATHIDVCAIPLGLCRRIAGERR